MAAVAGWRIWWFKINCKHNLPAFKDWTTHKSKTEKDRQLARALCVCARHQCRPNCNTHCNTAWSFSIDQNAFFIFMKTSSGFTPSVNDTVFLYTTRTTWVWHFGIFYCMHGSSFFFMHSNYGMTKKKKKVWKLIVNPMHTIYIVSTYHFWGKSDIWINKEDTCPPQPSVASTSRSLIKVDAFSVTLHEGANELAFTLIK